MPWVRLTNDAGINNISEFQRIRLLLCTAFFIISGPHVARKRTGAALEIESLTYQQSAESAPLLCSRDNWKGAHPLVIESLSVPLFRVLGMPSARPPETITEAGNPRGVLGMIRGGNGGQRALTLPSVERLGLYSLSLLGSEAA